MRVLLTGATGFLGRAIAAELEGRSIDVVRIGGPAVSGRGAIGVDVGDEAAVAALRTVGTVDAVVHAAGIAHRFGGVPETEYGRVNAGGAANVARLASAVNAGHFILISSVLVYGPTNVKEPITEGAPLCPADPYAQSKLDAERSVADICSDGGTALTVLRPAPMIGEGSRGNFARLIRAINNGRFVPVGRGENLKSALYVGDAARAVAVILENKNIERGTEIFNLSADPVPTNVMVSTIAAALGRRRPAISIPASLPRSALRALTTLTGSKSLVGPSRTLDKWLSTEIYSAEAIRAAYGFSPHITIPAALELEARAFGRSH